MRPLSTRPTGRFELQIVAPQRARTNPSLETQIAPPGADLDRSRLRGDLSRKPRRGYARTSRFGGMAGPVTYRDPIGLQLLLVDFRGFYASRCLTSSMNGVEVFRYPGSRRAHGRIASSSRERHRSQSNRKHGWRRRRPNAQECRPPSKVRPQKETLSIGRR